MKSADFAKTICAAILHLLTATVGIGVLSAFAFYSLKPALALFLTAQSLRGDVPLLLPLLPLQVTTALGCGFLVGRQRNWVASSRTAYFCWLLPALWFLLAVSAWHVSSVMAQGRWNHFLWATSPESKRAQLTFTLPFLTSIAYASGTYLAHNRKKAG
jgi:hypothetical protein